MATLLSDIIHTEEDLLEGSKRLPLRIKNRAFITKCLHQFFEGAAEKYPERLAIIHSSAQMSFREVNEKANQLARFLRRFGIGRGSVVALFLERSPELFIGLLGILKTGAAYVRLDPDDEIKRLSVVLKDADIFLVLTQSQLLSQLSRHHGPKLSLDSDWDVIAKEKETNLGRLSSPSDLACVIYQESAIRELRKISISQRSLVKGLYPLKSAIGRELSLLTSGKTLLLPEKFEHELPGSH